MCSVQLEADGRKELSTTKKEKKKKERKELSLFTQNIVVVAFVASVVQINDIVESHLGRN